MSRRAPPPPPPPPSQGPQMASSPVAARRAPPAGAPSASASGAAGGGGGGGAGAGGGGGARASRGTKANVRPNIAAATAAAASLASSRAAATAAAAAGRPGGGGGGTGAGAGATVPTSSLNTSQRVATGGGISRVPASTLAAGHSRSSSVHSSGEEEMELPSLLNQHDLHFPPSRALSPDRTGRGNNGGRSVTHSLNSSFIHNNAPSAFASRRGSLNASSMLLQPPVVAPVSSAFGGATPSPGAPLAGGGKLGGAGGLGGADNNFPLLSMSQLDSLVVSPPRPTRAGHGHGQQQNQHQFPPHLWQPSYSPPLGNLAASQAQQAPQTTQVHIHQYVSPPHGPGFSQGYAALPITSGSLAPAFLSASQQQQQHHPPFSPPVSLGGPLAGQGQASSSSQLYGTGRIGGGVGGADASMASQAQPQQQHFAVPPPAHQSGYFASTANTADPYASYGTGAGTRRPSNAYETGGATATLDGGAEGAIQRSQPYSSQFQRGIPQSLMSPRSSDLPGGGVLGLGAGPFKGNSNTTTTKLPSSITGGAMVAAMEGDFPPELSPAAQQTSNAISASYARFAALNESIRLAKVNSQAAAYAHFQAQLHKELYVLALEHWAHKEHLKVFRSWRFMVADRLHRLRHMQAHLAGKRSTRAFETWRFRFGWRRRLAALTLVSVEHWARSHARKSFLRLRDRVRRLHAKESSIIELKLRRLFDDWRLAAQVRGNQMARVQLVQVRVDRHERAKAFELWKQALFCTLVAREVRKRSTLIQLRALWHQWRTCQYYNRLETRLTVSVLSGVKKRTYADWRYVFNLHLMAAKYRRKQYTRTLLQRWISSAKRRQHVQALVSVAARHNAAQVFHSWRFAQRLQRAHLKAARFARVALQVHTLRAWQQAFHLSRRAALAWRMGESFQRARSVQTAIIRWARFARQSSHLRRAQRGVIAVNRSHLLRAALGTWIASRAHLLQGRAQSLQAQVHEIGYKLRAVMHYWSNLVRAKYGRPLRRIVLHRSLPPREPRTQEQVDFANLRASMSAAGGGAPFSPRSSSVRFEPVLSPGRRRGASTLLGKDTADFFTSSSSSLPARLTGHTRLVASELGEDEELVAAAGGEEAAGASSARLLQPNQHQVRVFVPYAAQQSMADLYHAHRNYRLILRRWSELARYSRAVQRAHRPRAELQYIRHLLRGWHRSARRSKAYTHAVLVTRANDRAALLVSAYNSWIACYNKQKHLDSLLARAYAVATEKMWLKWRFLLQVRRTLQLKRVYIEQRVVARRFYEIWRSKAGVRALLQSVLGRLALRWEAAAFGRWKANLRLELRFRLVRHRVVQACWFRCWRRQVAIKKNLVKLTQAWEQSRPRVQTQRLFDHWRAYLAANEQRRFLAAQHRLAKVLSVWRRRAHWEQFDRRCIATFAARRQLAYLVNAWQGWKDRLVAQRAELAATRRAAVHLWLRNVSAQQKERGMRVWAARRLDEQTRHRVLFMFYMHARRRRYVRRQTERARQQYNVAHLQPLMFAHWRRYVAQHKSAAAQAHALWAAKTTKQLFQRMMSKYRFRTALRAQLKRVVPFAGRPLQNIAVQLWRRYAASHKVVRQRMERFQAVFARPVAAMYRSKLLSDALHEWGVAFAIRRRTKALQSVLAVRTEALQVRRAWLDWSFHCRAGWMQKRILQRRFVVFLAARAQAASAGRQLRARTEGRKATAVLAYWRFKTHRLLTHRAWSTQFREQRVLSALLRDAYITWRACFQLLTGPLAVMEARRKRAAMQRRIADWLETLNSRNVYRWAVQLFRQKLASLLDRELHRVREAELARRRASLRAARAAQAEAEGRPFDEEEEADEVDEDLLASAGPDENVQRELFAPHMLPSMLSQSFGGVSAPASVLSVLPPALAAADHSRSVAGSNPAVDGSIVVLVDPSGSQLTVARLAAMVQRWRTLDISVPFVQWRGVLRARKAREAAHARAVTHHSLRTERATFACWTSYILRVRRARAALAMGRQVTLQHMMRRWHLFVSQERQLTAASQRANIAVARDAWVVWRQQLHWNMRLRAGEVSSVMHWAQRLVVSNFRQWRANARKFRSLSDRHRQLVHSQLYTLQYRAFAHWLSLFVVSSTQRRQLVLADNHKRATLFRRVLGAWAAYKARTRAQKEVASQGFAKEQQKLVANLWLFWRGKFARSRASKHRLALFLHRHTARVQADRFVAWRSWARRSRRDRTAVLAFVRGRLNRWVWRTWVEAQQDSLRDKQLQLEASRWHRDVLQAGRKLSALQFWRSDTRRELHLRSSLQFVQHQRIAPKFFRAWRTFVSRRRLAFRFFRARLTRRTMMEWFRRYSESRFLRSAEERVVERWECFSLRNVVRAWKSHARKQAQLRDCARLLVTSKGGVPVYSSCALLAAVPAPASLARLPASVLAVRDEERLRLLQQGSRTFFSKGAARHEVRATNEAKQTAFARQPLRLKGAGMAAATPYEFTGVAALLAPFSQSSLFDATVDPTNRRGRHALSSAAASDSMSLVPAASAATAAPVAPRSLSSPDPRAQALYNHMCVGLLSFHSMQRELAGAPLLVPLEKLDEDVVARLHSSVDDRDDHDAVIVYRSPSLLQRALFTFWFTSAQMLQRARQFRLLQRKRFVLDKFLLNREQRRLGRDKRQAASDLRVRQQERHAFRLWSAGVSVQKQVDAQAEELYWASSHRMAVRHGATALGFWADWAAKERTLRERRQQWDDNSRVYALSVWHWRAHRSAQLKASYETLWVAHHRGLLQARFDEWRLKAVQNARFTRMCAILHRLHGHDALKQWYSASLATNVADFTRQRIFMLQSQAVFLLRRFVTRRKRIRAAVEAITAQRQERLVRDFYEQWRLTRARVVRYKLVSDRHRRLVTQDFLTAWHEGAQLSRNLRQRDSDFLRILALRKTQLTWQHWRCQFRLRRLQRQNMDRRAREHLVEWIGLTRLRMDHERRQCKKVWAAWQQYVLMRRYASARAERFHELYRARFLMRCWRRSLLTAEQKAVMAEVALHLWKSTKRRQAGVMFGHWRALARAKKPIDVQTINRSRLSSMRELSHLVSSSSVSRLCDLQHPSRSRSPSPVSSSMPGRVSIEVPHLSEDKAAEEHKRASPSPSRSPSRSPLRSSLRSSLRPSAAASSRLGVQLPTASRATLQSLRTFLHSPPRLGLRVKRESDPMAPGPLTLATSDDDAYDDEDDSMHVNGFGASFAAQAVAHTRDDSLSSLDDSSALDSPRGALAMSIPPVEAMRHAAASHEQAQRDQADRLSRSLHASQLRG